MLIGEYTHTIDSKKRVSLPTKFRGVMGKKMIMTKGSDDCIYVYAMSEWKKVSEKLAGLSMGQADQRGFKRLMVAGATEVSLDSIGRVLVPDFLKSYGKLKTKVVFAGVSDHIEIWDEKIWKTYKEKIEGQADILAEKLGEIGVI
ncbi:MAG: division/cell wall cluster transcriptional repressor MraZ [Candidatus Pacebacteria bacterium]|nr:division/cell wall cluster transcriptional repressor MraZ [Candidatus Paceibacterota bacterium]